MDAQKESAAKPKTASTLAFHTQGPEMSMRRTIDWSSAIRDMRAASQVSPFLTAAGRFDLKTIMTHAIAEARVLGRTLRGLSWNARLSIALKLIWSKAKRALAAYRPALRLAA